MTIPFPLLVRGIPETLDFGYIANTQSFSSPLSGSVQTVELPGLRWTVSFMLRLLEEEDAAMLHAFLLKLRGRAGRFALYNFARPVPRGTATGTPMVAGAGQTGTTLEIDSLAAGATLLVGDFFGVNGELKMVVEDATADGTGAMAVTFEPPLRAAPADNAAVTLDRPTATFMLDEDSIRWLTRAPVLTDIPIAATEAFA